MNLIIGELSRIYFTHGKNLKTSLISILVFILIIVIGYNRFASKLMAYPDIIILVVSLIFFLRIILGSLTAPINEITKEITSKRIGFLSSLYFKIDMLIILRVAFLTLLNIVLALFFLTSIDVLLGENFTIVFYQYLIIFFTCFMGAFSLIGLGLLISGLMLYTQVKRSYLAIIQIIVFYGIFSFPKGHILIPFSNAKILIYNIIAGFQIANEHLINNFLFCIINSILFLLIGILIFRLLFLMTTKNKSLLSLNNINL